MRKISNKILIVALLALVALFLLAKVFRSPGLESNLRKGLVKVDSSAVTEIRILPSNAREQVVRLFKSGKNWTVEKDNLKFEADTASVKSILEMLSHVDAERMISRKKEKWETFNVGEKSTNVSVYNGSDQIANIHFGKSGFNQSSPGGYGGAYTYVRLSDEDEVYLVDGFYESTFNRTFSDWRNKAFMRLQRDLITKVSFNYPGDSSFVLEKIDSAWLANGRPTEQNKVEAYLGHLAYKNLNTFVDGFNPAVNPDIIIQAEGAGAVLGTIEGWKSDSGWTLHSSLQKEIYFSSSGSTVNAEVLVGLKNFLPTPK
jgi:Domain of unknown function (DUF4340)